ncbi:MAG: ankyrin repeat domain-containing protein [Fibrobacterota bacterium]|nr:ankyrin repeat domain-containing protein [Fibrobacterota bacterium]QQS04433.1 MAG: ankyrin repeat domain-containing protein [Fibrobacterota bacterium]
MMRSFLLILMMAFPASSQELWDLLQAREFELAGTLLDRGVYIDSKRDGLSAIHLAADAGDLEAVKFLIDHGSDVDDFNFGRITPLMIAATRGDLAMVELLVDQGASMEAISGTYLTPLMYAMLNHHDAVVDLMLKKQADPLFEPEENGEDPRIGNALFLTVLVRDTANFRRLYTLHPDPNLRLRDGKTLLMAAAEAKSFWFVQRLLSMQADISALDREGNSALHHACKAGADSSVLDLLLRNGADPDGKNASLTTPLHLAVDSGNAANVRVLLRGKIDVDRPYPSGDTPFRRAVERGLGEIALLLMDKGAKPVFPTMGPDDPSLVVPATSPLFAKLAIASGADVNGKVYPKLDSEKYPYERILTIAASQGWNDVIELALEKGADPNLTNSERKSPIQCALNNRKLDAFQLLLQRGAKPDTGLMGGHLHNAVEFGLFSGGFRILLGSGVDVNYRDLYGRTALMYAAMGSQVGSMDVLLQSNADPTLRDADGRSALHDAIASRCFECAKLLVENGASVRDPFSEGQSLVSSAVRVSDTLMVDWLQAKGAPVVLENGDYETVFGWFGTETYARYVVRRIPKIDLDKALLNAATFTNIGMVRFLISKGANPNARDEIGQTPLIISCNRSGSREVREFLLRKGANPKLRDHSGKTSADHCRSSRDKGK